MNDHTRLARDDERRDGGTRSLLLALCLTAVVSNLPILRHALYPFRLFTTWVHEMSHGLAAILVGGDFVSLVIAADGSGLAYHSGVQGLLSRAFVASAGYLGAALFGIALVSSRMSRPAAKALLLSLAIAMFGSVLFWVRDVFAAVACLLLGLCLAGIAMRLPPRWQPAFVGYLGAQTCLEGLLDIRRLYSTTEKSDAVTLSELFWLPPWFWATLWLVISLLALALALRWLPLEARDTEEPGRQV